MFKPSRYNFYTFDTNDEMLLTNTYTGRYIKIPQEKVNLINGYLNGETAENNSIVDFLYERGILVDKVVEERLEVRNRFTQMQSRPILTLTILPTEQCNFRCVYCYESFQKKQMSQEVQDAIIEFVKKNIHNYVGIQVSWFGGEPLLAMNIVSYLSTEIRRICKEKSRSYAANITTNAYLLKLDTFKELLKLSVLDYQITIDGLRESHNRQRPLNDGSSTYDVIVNNLLRIKETVKSGMFRIVLRINVSISMITEIPYFINWYNENFGNDRRFCLFIKMAGDYGGEKVKLIQKELISNYDMQQKFFGAVMESDLKHCNLINTLLFSVGGMLCTASLRNALVIDAVGDIRKCTCKLDDNEINLFGNILNKKVETTYNFIRWNEPDENEACTNCFFYPICMSGYCKYKSISGMKPCCPIEKRFVSEYLKIFNRQNIFEIFPFVDEEL